MKNLNYNRMETRSKSRILMLLLLAFACCIPVPAQDDYSTYEGRDVDDQRRLFHFGLKGGVNISSIYDTQAEDLSETYKVGFVGGFFFSIPLGAVFGIQPEVLYSKKGYSGEGNITTSTFRYTRNFDYIDVPIQLQIKPSESVTILAGPMFSWLLNKRFTFKDGSVSVEEQTALRNSNIRKNTFGVAGGLDLNLYPIVLSGRVGFDLRDNNGDGTTTDPRFKNAWVQATFGVIF
jgi:hypothetical protein